MRRPRRQHLGRARRRRREARPLRHDVRRCRPRRDGSRPRRVRSARPLQPGQGAAEPRRLRRTGEVAAYGRARARRGAAAVSAFAPHSAAELADWLASRPGRVRLQGGGSRAHRAAPADGAQTVRLAGIAAIERLDAPDQTCSVDCGVRREELDAALAPHGLELPCPGGGTIGGLFAADPLGAAAHGGQSPRSLLLGVEGLLADGTAF
ncbi:MAG: FAD-binding oxidoreductase, partial [Planctomycetes bacterium]|nr:FAD-binding oxidoreductase [Planctomycetota bacterium]